MHILNPILPQSLERSYFDAIFGTFVHVILGGFVWLLVFVLRQRLLYHVLILKGRFTFLNSIILPAIVLYTPLLVYNIVVYTVFRSSAFVWNDKTNSYDSSLWAGMVNFAGCGFYLLLIAYYNYHLKSILPLFNEHRITFWATILCGVYLVLNLLYVILPQYSKMLAYIIFFSVLLSSQFWFLYINLLPVYRYFFAHDAYLKEYMGSSVRMTYARAVSNVEIDEDAEIIYSQQLSQIIGAKV